jgi:hypothetical protein
VQDDASGRRAARQRHRLRDGHAVQPCGQGVPIGQEGLAAVVALLVPPEDPPDEPEPDEPEPDEPEPDEPEPDEPEPDELEALDEEFEESEPDDDDSDLPVDPFDVVSEPEERESVR